MQQPVQLEALHALVSTAHAPLVQAALRGHVTHACPPTPHAVSEVPTRHVFPWQHPGQFCGVHVVALLDAHVPPPPSPTAAAHTRPCEAQSTHACASFPHELTLLPSWQTPL